MAGGFKATVVIVAWLLVTANHNGEQYKCVHEYKISGTAVESGSAEESGRKWHGG